MWRGVPGVGWAAPRRGHGHVGRPDTWAAGGDRAGPSRIFCVLTPILRATRARTAAPHCGSRCRPRTATPPLLLALSPRTACLTRSIRCLVCCNTTGTRVLISLWDSLMFGRVPKSHLTRHMLSQAADGAKIQAGISKLAEARTRARPSPIPSPCTQSTRARIEWRR